MTWKYAVLGLAALLVGILAVPAFDFITHRMFPALRQLVAWKTQLLFAGWGFAVSWATQMMASTMACAPNCDVATTQLNAQHAAVTAVVMTVLGYILKHGQQTTQIRNAVAGLQTINTSPTHDPGA